MTTADDNDDIPISENRRRSGRLTSWLDHSAIAARGLPNNVMKKRPINYISASLDILVLIILLGSLIEPKWLHLRGGGCNHDNIGLGIFFMSGRIISRNTYDDYHITSTQQPIPKFKVIYDFGSVEKSQLVDCVTYEVVTSMRFLLAFIFAAIICTLIQFGLDIVESKRKLFRLLQINAIGNIVSVVITICCTILCYWAATKVEVLQEETKPKIGAKVIVEFGLGFYMVATASAVSILAIGTNCLRPLTVLYGRDHSRRHCRNHRDRASRHSSAHLNPSISNRETVHSQNASTDDVPLLQDNLNENLQPPVLSIEELERLLGPDPFTVLPSSQRQPPAYSP